MNARGCVPVKPYFWAPKFEFYIIFTRREISSFFCFFQPLRYVNTCLSLFSRVYLFSREGGSVCAYEHV